MRGAARRGSTVPQCTNRRPAGSAARVSDRLDLPEPPGSVALVRLSAIGDTVHAMPMVASLRRAWPECRITWVIQPGPLELMRGRPDVDEFLVFERSAGAGGLLDLRRRTAGRRFDLVVTPHPYLKAGLVTRLLDAPVRVGYDRARAHDLTWIFTTHRIPPGPEGHVQDEYFEFLEYLGVPVRREWDFHFTEQERRDQEAFFREIDRPVLAVVPRSSDPKKDWILDRYARVIDVAGGDLGLRPILVGGESEGERADAAQLARSCRFPPRVELRNDLRRLAWILDKSSVVLAPDTGPLHMAVALGTPTIGLYGYTDPKRSGPYGRFDDLLVDRFTRPGETRPSRRSRPGNMERITVEEVIEKLERARERYARGPVGQGSVGETSVSEERESPK